MANIANLAVQLSVNTGRFTSGMRGAISPIKSFQSAIGTVNASAASLWGALTGLAGGTALGIFIKKSLDGAEQLGVLSDRLGLSTENLQAMQLAAKQNNIDLDGLTGGLEKYNKTLAMANAGAPEAIKIFKALGLDFQQLANMDTKDALGEVSEAINALGTASEKALAANLLFGKSGQKLIPLFQAGSGAIDEAEKKLQSWGLTLDRIDAAKADAANDKFDELGFILDTVGQVMAVEVAPYLEAIIGKFIEAGSSGSTFGQKALDAVEVVTKGLSYLGDAWQVLEIAINTGQITLIYGWKLWVDALDEVYYGIQKVISLIPGMDIKPEHTFKGFSEGLDDQLKELTKKQKELLDAPWKHNEVAKWFDDVRQKADKNAQAQIKNNQDIGDSLDGLYNKRNLGEFKQGTLRDVTSMQLSALNGTQLADVQARASGVAASSVRQTVSDPQLQETNKYLRQIADNTEDPTAVAS